MLSKLLQLLGILVLVPTVAIVTLQRKHLDDDGPSLVFAGGPLLTGAIYRGREPDWSFLAEADQLELQLYDPVRSYLVLPVVVNGRLSAVAPKMDAVLRTFRSHWAEHAVQGDGAALIRVNGVRYPRTITRIVQGGVLDGVAGVLTRQHNMPTTRQSIIGGNLWVFELTPRASR
ncbi:MAG: hypothetical protein H7A06_00075 [Pseudomonadales bacterium]|nr:hypothetical protein [Pseudomonadales bacterium]